MNAPKDGYILPLWDGKGFYRATAQAYLKQTTALSVENRDGNWYNLKQIEDSMVTLFSSQLKQLKIMERSHLQNLIKIRRGSYKKGTQGHKTLMFFRNSDTYKLTSHEKIISYNSKTDTFSVGSLTLAHNVKAMVSAPTTND